MFLDSDRVNFQKEGFSKEELLAGLALVLPKNIWQYVVQIPRMAELGRVFVLQGGTQYNLAALKAQVDYIKKRVPNAEVYLHPHTGEAGAIGAAFEALRVVTPPRHDDVRRPRSGDRHRVRLDQRRGDALQLLPEQLHAHVHRHQDASTARPPATSPGFSCEKGTVENMDALKELNKERQKRMKQYPNLVDYEAKLAFKSFYEHEPMPEHGTPVDDIVVKRTLLGAIRHKPVEAAVPARERGGLGEAPRRPHRHPARPEHLLDGPVLAHVLRDASALDTRNVVFSDETSEEMWQAGCKYGSVDPCYPSKVVPGAHPQPAVQAPREEAAQLHLLPGDHARPDVHREPDGHGELPGRLGHAEGHPRGVHEGDRLLRRARHQLPRHGGDAEREA